MWRFGVLVILAAVLAACQTVKPDAGALAANRAIFDQMRTGQDQAVLAQLAPTANPPAIAAVLARLKAVTPSTAPRSATPVKESVLVQPGGRVDVLVVEYDFADRTIRFATTLVQPKGTQGWKLQTLALLEATHKELAANTLSLEGRSPGQLGYLALALASPLLMLAAVVKVLTTPGLANRWLWAAFALVGLFSFKMNFASGVMLINWMALEIVGFWMGKAPSTFDPWIISATVPIGAILILGGLVARRPRAPVAAAA